MSDSARLRFWLPVGLLIAVLLIVVVLVRGGGDGPPPAILATPDPTPDVSAPAAERPTVLFIGDSYTAGVGASRGSTRWTSVVAAENGWVELNLGRSGSGYTSSPPAVVCGFSRCPDYREMAERAVDERPDIVVVAGGQNDTVLAYSDFAREGAAIAATFATLRAGLPDATIVALGPKPIWGVTPPLLDIERAVRVAALSNGGLFVSLSTPAVIQPSFLLEDGIHVNDDGHAAIADRVLAALDCWDEATAAACSSHPEDASLDPDAPAGEAADAGPAPADGSLQASGSGV